MSAIENFLDDRNITVHNEGKNVSQGWLGIQCPFPGCGDTSNHCGITPDRKGFSCWRCGETGTVVKLIAQIENINERQAYKLLKSFESDIERLKTVKKATKTAIDSTINVLEEFSPQMTTLCRHYLESRHFNAQYIWEKYKLHSAAITSNFVHRLIIPVYQAAWPVTVIGRDMTGRSDLRYKNLAIEHSIVPVKDCLYNIDNAHENVVVVEGCFDTFRIGDGCVCTFGTSFTRKQVLLLSTYKNVFVMYDREAVQKAERLAYQLADFVKHVEIITIDAKDPAELTENDVKNIRKELQLDRI